MNLPNLEADQEQLSPSERCKLARMALRIAGAENAPPGSFLRAHLHFLDKKLANANKRARAEHWKSNSAAALEAARAYLEAANSGTPLSLDDAAAKFQMSARSVSRHIQLLRKAAGAEKEVEPVQ